jgi:hypothetical protein
MHRHLHAVRVVVQLQDQRLPRPAKVVQLDVRRKARLEAAPLQRQPSRPAA